MYVPSLVLKSANIMPLALARKFHNLAYLIFYSAGMPMYSDVDRAQARLTIQQAVLQYVLSNHSMSIIPIYSKQHNKFVMSTVIAFTGLGSVDHEKIGKHCHFLARRAVSTLFYDFLRH